MLNAKQFVLAILGLCLVLYVLRCLLCRSALPDPGEEYFEPEADADDEEVPPPNGVDAATALPSYDLQAAIDLSDVTVSEKQRSDYRELRENAQQIPSVDERFRAAKRKLAEHGLTPGVQTEKARRQRVEALVRPTVCGRRTRSWRTEFSDTLRGDVVPKNMESTMGMMRIGRSDPSVDLHPGALGTMSGMSGAWVSEESVPENAFDDMEVNV